MKILINGSTVGEIFTSNTIRKIEDVRKIKRFKEDIVNEVCVTFGSRDISDADKISVLDKAIEHIKRNKKMYIRLVFVTALMLQFGIIDINALSPNLTAIDRVGGELLALMEKIAYWVLIILCTKDVLVKCMQGRKTDAGATIMLYLMAFGTIHFLPWAFDLIKELFK